MAEDKIIVDDEKVAGVELSKEEKKRLKRQEKKLKKFGLKDESKMGKMELFFYRIENRRRIKEKSELVEVLRETYRYLFCFVYLEHLVHIRLYILFVQHLNRLLNYLFIHLNYSFKTQHWITLRIYQCC